MRKWFKKNDDEIIEIQVDDTERRIIVKVCDADHPSIKDHYERC